MADRTSKTKKPQASNLKPVYVEGIYRIMRRSDDPTRLQINATVDGVRYRFGAGTDLRQAKLRLHSFMAEVESGYKPGVHSDDVSWVAVAEAITRRQRNAARARGIPFEIGQRLVYSLMQETGFRCSISGIAYSKPRPKFAEVDPWAPSIDRIDNRQGYIVDNVRMVTAAANYAMNRWGYDMLLRLANGVVRSARMVSEEPNIIDAPRARLGTTAPLDDVSYCDEMLIYGTGA